MYLFIDTTETLKVGLLDETLSFQCLECSNEKKSSAIIHSLIQSVLNSNGLEIKNLKSVLHVAGPGSYTGMRVGAGIVQVLEWQGVPSFSFYHFEIPKILGVPKGVWVANAFKGEKFFYRWDEGEVETFLKSDNEAMIWLSTFDGQVFMKCGDEKAFSTDKIIKDDSHRLFTTVLNERMKREPYYYRMISEEFKSLK